MIVIILMLDRANLEQPILQQVFIIGTIHLVSRSDGRCAPGLSYSRFNQDILRVLILVLFDLDIRSALIHCQSNAGHRHRRRFLHSLE